MPVLEGEGHDEREAAFDNLSAGILIPRAPPDDKLALDLRRKDRPGR